MSDLADKLRDILELTDCSRGQWEPLLDALVAERDEWEVAAKKISGARNRWKKRAEAAEARVQQLKAALTQINDNALAWHGDEAAKSRAICVIARVSAAALADVPDKETP